VQIADNKEVETININLSKISPQLYRINKFIDNSWLLRKILSPIKEWWLKVLIMPQLNKIFQLEITSNKR